MIHVISLGAGVQSSTMALMAAHGEITPPVIAAIFADTKAEPKSVYNWLDFLESKLPFPVYRVTNGSLAEDTLRVRERKDKKGFWVPSGIPHFSTNYDGTRGHGRRQCTHDFKITPIQRQVKVLIGSDELKRWKKFHHSDYKEFLSAKKAKRTCDPMAWERMQDDSLVVQSIGISLDEVTRMKPSREPWIKHRWPLIEMGVRRSDCLAWMKSHQYPEPPRSACVFCPYHSNSEWRRLRDEEPIHFAEAVEFEKRYREAKKATVWKKTFDVFLHPDLVPLDQVNLGEQKEQMNLFENECEGMCGV